MSKDRRSRAWYGKLDKDGFIHRSWMKNQGFPDHSFDGRPIIGICNTWSELTPCNSGLRELAEGVKRGVWEAGGFPVEFPVMSLGETQMKPTAMLFRNLLAMDVEESIRAYGIDGVVLLGGCDKTTPGQLMGAASVDLPTIVVSSGPMLNGKWQGRDIGSGTDVWKFSEAVRAGEMTLQDFMAAESGMSRSKGVCMTMGTASTMAALVEAMGMSLPTNAALPAVDARRMALAHLTGKRIVGMVEEGLKPSDVLTKEAFENAILANAAVGGSTDRFLEHEGEAYVFENIEDMKANIDRDDLPVTADTILVLKGCGPKGYPGMPEVGNMPIPARLVKDGVRDMVRISDARMSGTAYGTVVLHVSPEANAGGNLALVMTGDRIRLSIQDGALDLLISEEELDQRRAAWTPDEPHYTRGYAKLYIDTVMQADKGADLDFLVGKDTRLVTRESH